MKKTGEGRRARGGTGADRRREERRGGDKVIN